MEYYLLKLSKFGSFPETISLAKCKLKSPKYITPATNLGLYLSAITHRDDYDYDVVSGIYRYSRYNWLAVLVR